MTAEKNKILLLGTETSVFDDIQDRILRENIMRNLRQLKIPVVKVMDLEQLIIEDGLRIRKPAYKKIPYYVSTTNSSHAVFSKLTPSKDKFILTVYVYSKSSNKIMAQTKIIDSETDFTILYKELTSDIVEIIKNIPGD